MFTRLLRALALPSCLVGFHISLLVGLAGAECEAQTVNVSVRVVDQTSAEISGSFFKVAALGGGWNPTGITVSLPIGTHTFVINPSVGGRTLDLTREQSVTIGSTTTSILLEWARANVQLRLLDQVHQDIVGSNISLTTIAGYGPNVRTGSILRLPITDESVYPDMVGTDKDGYTFELNPAVSFVPGFPLALHLFRRVSSNEVSQATTTLEWEWKTSQVRLHLHDQATVDIPGSRISLASLAGQTFFVSTGTTITLPITDESVYPEMQGVDKDGYTFELNPAVSFVSGFPLALHLFRRVSRNEVSQATTTLEWEWRTATASVRLHDQWTVDIPGSFIQLTSAAGQTFFVPTGSVIAFPVTDEALYPTVVGLDANGYTFGLSPNVSLYRTSSHNEVTGSTTQLAWQWIVHDCPLRVVDAIGRPVPGSSLSLPSVFGPFTIGHSVRLPVTDNSLYPTLSGTYANGYPIIVSPGDVAPAAGTFDFEVLASGILQPGTFTIAGNTYSLVCQFNRPPIADAGVNRAILSSVQASTTIVGNGIDPDFDPLTYRWLEGISVLIGSAPVSPNGACELPLGTLPSLGVGDHTLTLEVSDGLVTATSSMHLTVGNSPPVVTCSGMGTYQLGVDSVRLGATVSDFDGEPVTWTWKKGSTVLASGAVPTNLGGAPVDLPVVTLTTGSGPTAALGVGSHVLELVVQDGSNPALACPVTVLVVDTEAPRLAPTSNVGVLWPPDHRMVDIVIQANATDASLGQVLLSASVTSNEDPAKNGSGQTILDYTTPVINQVTGQIFLQLRAERSGRGRGRIYTILIRATDASNNVSTTSLTIRAPHDQGGN